MIESAEKPRFHIRKINGRLGIYDRTTGALAYGPPRFLVIRSREGLKVLADKFEAAGGPEACIAAITRFEAKRSPTHVRHRRCEEDEDRPRYDDQKTGL